MTIDKKQKKQKKQKKIKPPSIQKKATLLHSMLSPPIVGIGASAGGIEAIIKLLTDLPNDTGFSFVVIMHLDPKSDSDLAAILGRVSSMPVAEINQSLIIKPNCIYTIPSDHDVRLSSNKKFKTMKRKTDILHMPIDIFLMSLAENKKDNSIGIILSGTGSDGTLGLQAIRAEGGITFAQKPSSAKYDTMPYNAIRSGAVDATLTPKEMAKELARIATHPYIKPTHLAVSSKESSAIDQFDDLPQGMTKELGVIIKTLRKVTHFDFAQYKSGTISRRIKRRMILLKISNLAIYAEYVAKHVDEAKALADDFLITITRFFRDAEVFETLKKRIFPHLLKKHDKDTPLRIWVPGCATGEEAYSIAILLLELLEKNGFPNPIRIFATDISENALQRARTGFFPEGIVRDVSKERLQHFFNKVEGGYCVSKFLREQCIFSRHDLTRDPPFAKIDFLSCRNLLIYFNSELQKQIIPILHYALNEGGVLLLGRSEAPAGFPNLFSFMDKKSRIYLRKETIEKMKPLFQSYAFLSKPMKPFNRDVAFTDGNQFIQKEADRLLLERYAPPCVLINAHMDIIMTRGKISLYLGLSTGQPRLNIMKMASMELAMEIRHAIQAATKSRIIIQKRRIQLKENDRIRVITLRVEVLNTFLKTKEPYYLIEFEEDREQSKKETLESHHSAVSLAQSKKMNTQRKVNLLAEQHYQSLIEQFEAAQEETITSNEELQSSNEELQSTNEELETAKEELQSSNEELSTVNEELHSRNLEITLLNKDLNNLLTNIDIPIVLVDDEKRIRNFTPSSSKILKLIASDVGRPLGDIKPRIKGINLDHILSEVMNSMTEKVIEIKDDDDCWHKLIVKPYQTPLNKIEGAVVILLDINALKRATEGIKKTYEDAQAIIKMLPIPLLLIGSGLNVSFANEAFYEIFKMR